MRSFDSANTQPQAHNAPAEIHNPRRLSIQDIQTENQNIFGVFNLDDYTVMRGFIPGKERNTRLHYTKIEPHRKIANICIIPSYAGKPDDYLDIADTFAKQNFVIHILNIRGLASHSGIKVDCELEKMFSDVECLLRCCDAQLPIFFCAFGFGCTVLTSLLVDNPHLPISGIILVSPTIIVEEKTKSLKRSICKWLCRKLFGQLLVHVPVSLTSLTKSNNHLKRMIQEGSGVQYAKLKVLETLENASKYMISNSYRIFYPTLLCYGKLNKFSSIPQLENYFYSLGSSDKTLKIYEKGYHYLHCDEQGGLVKEEIIKWINKRASGKKYERALKIPHLQIYSEFPSFFSWKRLGLLLATLYFIWRYFLKKHLAKYIGIK